LCGTINQHPNPEERAQDTNDKDAKEEEDKDQI
jgi:hypothetical protein